MKILNQDIQHLRHKIDEHVKDLHQVAIDIKSKDLSDTVSDLRNRINEPFMFVIVGEVKAGKSSFVNALLSSKEEIAKVAPDPCTDTIQQILYGEEKKEVQINPYLKKIFLPASILKDIAIVDTPGTNTISDHHQEITERFIPAADLIVFVFEAKNPYRQSAWDFFDFIHEDWRKKVVFVLQQKDLMNEDDLNVNINGVIKYAQKKGITAPFVYALSAKEEQEELENSGFAPLRSYIAENITGGQAPYLKLENNIDTALNVLERIHKGLGLRRDQWNADKAFRTEIHETLDKQEGKSNYQVDLLRDSILSSYDASTQNAGEELKEGLSIGNLFKKSFLSLFSKKESAKVWLEELTSELEQDLHQSMTSKLNHGVEDIADSIQQMTKLISLKIQNSESILKENHELFGNIAEQRHDVLRDLRDTFSSFMNKTENFLDPDLFPKNNNITNNIATGSGMAIIGTVLMGMTQAPMFDITGGILTAIGFLFAGITIGVNRSKVIRQYEEEVEKGRHKLSEEIEHKLKTYIANIKRKIDKNFTDFDHLIREEEGAIQNLQERHDVLLGELEGLKKDFNAV